MGDLIEVKVDVKKDMETVWKCWNDPKHIVNWYSSSKTWHTPKAINNLNNCKEIFEELDYKCLGFTLGSMQFK